MSLNYRAFQPGLSPSVMAYSQPALWSRLLFLIAGFRNNCPAPFKKRQLDNDLVQKAYLSVTEPGNDQDLFAYQVTAVSVIISTCWRDWQHTQGCPSPALPCPGHSWALVWDAPSWGFRWCWAAGLKGGCSHWHISEVMPCGAVLGRGIPGDALLKTLPEGWWKGWGKQPSPVWVLPGFFWVAS